MKPVPAWKVEWVKRLHNAGKSYREIRKITGLARETIARIVHGRRKDPEIRRREQRERDQLHSGPIERCPKCGRRMVMPCLACLAATRNADLSRTRRGRDQGGFDPPLGLDLRDHHKARYETVRANRPTLEQDEPPFPFL